jgi:glycosyltransferase involved in cell wall biosynthesis
MNLYRNIDRERVQFDFVKHTPEKGAFEDEIVSMGGIIYQSPHFSLKNILKYRNWWLQHLRTHPEHQLVHGHYFTASAVYFSFVKKYRRVAIAHSHIAYFGGIIKRLLCMRIEKEADYCLACGWEAGKLLYPHRHFIVINNAIDVSQFSYSEVIRNQYRRQLGVDNNIVLGIVANFSDHKNPKGVIELVRHLVSINDKYKLIWVGDGGGLKNKIVDLVKTYNMEEYVMMLGKRDDVPMLMQAMDAFILPSLYEGLPVVLIEAQAAGLKCFTSNTVTSEANISGNCTYLPLDEWQQWADSIAHADLRHKDMYNEIAEAGYDIHTTAKWLQEFYLMIEKNTRGGGNS